MTTTTAQLTLRPPGWARALFLAWPLIVLAVLFLEFRPSDAGSWAGTILIAGFGVLLCWRLFAQAVLGSDDGRLVVRNLLAGRTVRREDITAVTVDRGRGGPGSGWFVHLHLRDGRLLRLDVTQVPLRGPFRARVERQAAAVRNWVAGQPIPFV